MTRLSRHHIILLHAQLIAATGGAEGIRDESLLDSALEPPYSGTSGVEFYPSVPGKAARLAFGLVSNHPFVDGNKRIGIQAMLVLLHLNGVSIEYTDAELISLGIGLAEGKLNTDDAEKWILLHIVEEIR